MRPIILGAGFALLGVLDLAFIDLQLVPTALAAGGSSEPAVTPPPVATPDVSTPTMAAPLIAPTTVAATQAPEPAKPSASAVVKPPLNQAPPMQLTLHFDVNARDPIGDPASNLDAMANALASDPALHVTIEGHSDHSGTRGYNDELSRVRANAMAEALVRRGVARNRLSAIAHGARVPMADGTDSESLARNRRVELRVERRKP